MRPPASPFVLVIVGGASIGALISCAPARQAKLRDLGTSSRVGTTIVTSGRMNAPRSTPETTRSCVGPALCREDVITTADPDAIVEIDEACVRLGGTVAESACPRDEAAAKCSGGSEHGTVTVYAYARGADPAEVVTRLSEQCEALAGTFEALARR